MATEVLTQLLAMLEAAIKPSDIQTSLIQDIGKRGLKFQNSAFCPMGTVFCRACQFSTPGRQTLMKHSN